MPSIGRWPPPPRCRSCTTRSRSFSRLTDCSRQPARRQLAASRPGLTSSSGRSSSASRPSTSCRRCSRATASRAPPPVSAAHPPAAREAAHHRLGAQARRPPAPLRAHRQGQAHARRAARRPPGARSTRSGDARSAARSPRSPSVSAELIRRHRGLRSVLTRGTHGQDAVREVFDAHAVRRLASGQYQLLMGLHLDPRGHRRRRRSRCCASAALRGAASPSARSRPSTTSSRRTSQARPLADPLAEEMLPAPRAQLRATPASASSRPAAASRGIVHVIGPGAGPHAARHDDLLRRLAHLARTARSARIAFGIGTSQVRDVLATQCLAAWTSSRCAASR